MNVSDLCSLSNRVYIDGQTGSGKSYSMMGYGQDRGIIPLTCSALFDRIEEKLTTEPNVTYTVEVSFMEVSLQSEFDQLTKGLIKLLFIYSYIRFIMSECEIF